MTYVDIESVRDSYAVAKLNSEFTVKLNSESIGYNYIILRIFNVYGPNMVGSKYGQVIPEFIQRLTNTEYPLKIIGTGEETRSFCYIDDHVLLTDLLYNEIDAYNQVINLGNPHEISIKELAEHVMMAMNLQPEIISSARRPFDTVRRCRYFEATVYCGRLRFHTISIGLEKGFGKSIIGPGMKTNSFYVLHNGKNQFMNELSQEIECALNIRNLSCNSSVSTLYF